MQSLLTLATVGLAVTGANAKWFRRATSWEPAKETNAVAVADNQGFSPKPTDAPGLLNLFDHELKKRAGTSTCAYYSQYTSSAAIVCLNGASCIYNSIYSVIGCCDLSPSLCTIQTTCIDRTDSALYTSTNAFTVYCSETDYPHCVTYGYDARDVTYSGYHNFYCGVSKTSYDVFFTAPGGSATSGAGSTTRSSAASTTTPSSTATSTTKASTTTSPSGTTTSAGGSTTVTVGGSSDTSSATSSPTAAASSSGTPVGAIVGGVVGGVAGLALIGLGIFFLVRYSKKKPADQTQPGGMQGPPPAGPGSPYSGPQPGQPPMGQAPPPAGYAGFAPAGYAASDNRSSIAPTFQTGSPVGKSPYENGAQGMPSPSMSPDPHNTSPVYYGGSAPSAGTPPNPQYGAYNQPPQQPPHQPYTHSAAELSTDRPDHELRELA